MGMPSMGIYSWELIKEYGVRNLVRIGSAGSFSEKVKLRDIVFGVAASTDSNYAHTFELNGTYSPCADFDLLLKAKASADKLGILGCAATSNTAYVF
jgi:purine-nucleoside phosphorylase